MPDPEFYVIQRRMFFRITILNLFLSGLGACASLLPEAHKVEIQQGTIIDPETAAQLRIGMTREQVRFLLGNPTLTDIFHPQRWDSLNYTTRAGEDAPVSRLTLYFEQDRLVRIDNRLQPDGEPTPAD